ncbi:MAG: 4-oxalocrotonate tautomerase [Bradyrhizobium sp.]|nr:4-oxalocrotonate tautomerase [Bradyrhizobium sp.]
MNDDPIGGHADLAGVGEGDDGGLHRVIHIRVLTDDQCVLPELQDRRIRFKIDQMARTLPGATLRAWWMRHVEEIIAPFVKERGFEWEVQIGELPSDLWTLNGFVPPPFQSIAEKRWVEDNAISAYSEDEKVPVNLSLAPGVCD